MANKYNSLDRMKIKNLISLCYAIDEFNKFNKDMLELQSFYKSSRINTNLMRIVEGKLCLFAKKEKELYQNNEYIINLLKYYGDLESFLWDNYNTEGINTYKGLKNFMEYINKHRENIDIIIANLEALQELGFETIIFDEKLDFTKETYTLATKLEDNLCVEYLDNLEAVPTYNKQIVKYQTKQTAYKITLSLSSSKISPTNYFNSVALNSLIFSPERLPESLCQIDTFDKIIALSNTVEEESNIIKDAVDLGVSINDLYQVYTHIYKKIEKLDSVESKKELISLLNKIKNNIQLMEYISEEHAKVIASKYSTITSKLLEEEKESYTRKRFKLL